MPRLIVMLTGTLGTVNNLSWRESKCPFTSASALNLILKPVNEMKKNKHMAPQRQSSSMLHRKHTMQRSGPVYAEGISIITIIVVIMLTSVAAVHTVEEPKG